MANIHALLDDLNPINDRIDGLGTGFQGTIKIADTKTEPGIYIPTEAGVYPNAGGLEYDPTEGLTYFILDSGVWTKGVTPINFTPTGVVEEGNAEAVSGGEVFDKTLTKSVFMDITYGKNLFNKDDSEQGNIKVDGLWQFSAAQLTTPFIPVKAGTYYTMSGGYGNPTSKRVLVFGSKNNTDIVEFIQGSDTFFIESDGYIKTNVRTTTSDIRDTLQIEEGTEATSYEPYIGVIGETIKEEYLPSSIPSEKKIASFNRLSPDLLKTGYTVDSAGSIIVGSSDDYVYGPIIPEQSSYIYARNMPDGRMHTITLLRENGELNFRGQALFEGSSGTTRNRPNTFRVLLSGKFNDPEELSRMSLSFFRAMDATMSVNKDSTPFVRKLPTPIFPKLARKYVNPTGGEPFTHIQFTISHDGTGGEEVIIPLMLNWGSAPAGTPERSGFLFMQEKCKRDFSNISIVEADSGEKKPIEIHSGNYSLIPSLGERVMFQDPTERNIIIGGNASSDQIMMSLDYGLSFSQIAPQGRLCFMSSSGDIFYMKKTSTTAEIARSTKASGYTDDVTVLPLDYVSSVIGKSQVTEDDLGNIYIGTYQTEFDTRVYKSSNGGLSFSLIFSNTIQQHVHLIFFEPEKKELWLSCDGSVDMFQNKGVVPDNGMALYKSSDYGDSWELVPLPFTSDKGLSFKLGDFYFGAGEANVKYTPSLFRTRDYQNIEVLDESPAMTSIIKKFKNTILQIPQAYRDYGYTKILMSEDYGKSFLPIFDSKFFQSDFLGTAYRYGSSDTNAFTDENGDEFMILTTNNSELPPLRFSRREDDFQALVYLKTKLKQGINTFRVIEKEGDNPLFEIDSYGESIFSANFKDNHIELSDGLSVPYNQDTLQSVGTFKSFRYPYEANGVSVNLQKGVRFNVDAFGVKAIRFGYKALTNNQNGVVNDVSILKTDGFEIRRDIQSVVVILGGQEYTFPMVFRSQFAFIPLDLVLTLDGANMTLFGNGYMFDSLPCTVGAINVQWLSLQEPEASYLNSNTDLISNIELFSKQITQDDAIRLFEGNRVV